MSLLRLPFVTSLWFLLEVSIGSLIICLLCHCCVLDFDCLFLCFVTSLCFLLMVSIVSLYLLRQCSVLGFDCLFFCLLRHYAFSSWYPLFHYQSLSVGVC